MAGLTLEKVSHLDKKQAQIVTEEINCPATPPARVVYSITYALPGQVGFCIPQISEDPKYLQRLLALLADEPLVISQQININNTTAGSIVITYKSGVMSDVEMRSHLCNLIQFAGNRPLALIPQNPTPTPSPPAGRGDFDVSQRQGGVLLFDLCKKSNVEVLPATANQLKSYPVAKNLEDKQDTKPKSSLEVSVSKTKSNSVSSTHSQPVIQQTKQPTKVAYSVAHAIPGRVRFRIPRIASDPKYVQRLEALLKSDSTVTSERVNSAAVSIVITYKSGMMRDSQKRVQSFLSAAISHLASLIQSANDPAAAIS